MAAANGVCYTRRRRSNRVNVPATGGSPMRETLAQMSSLSADQVAQFHRDGFVAVRQGFTPDEIAEIRDTFMETAKNGPVEGLSESKQAQNRGGTAENAPTDPTRNNPPMLHPHHRLDKTADPS